MVPRRMDVSMVCERAGDIDTVAVNGSVVGGLWKVGLRDEFALCPDHIHSVKLLTEIEFNDPQNKKCEESNF